MARWLVPGAVALAACRGQPTPGASPPPPPPDATAPVEPPSALPSSSAAPALAPLPGFFEALPVAGHPDAWVSLPTGATSRRPVVVVIHGAGDRPDWQCGGWRRATSGFPFIVCPRGRVAPGEGVTPDDVRYTLPGGKPLLAYVDGALAALASRYPGYVDPSTPLLAGFSLGSYAILQLAVDDPTRFPRIALIEGVTGGLDDARARAFLHGGGVRVLFGCGQVGCRVAAKTAAARLSGRDHLDAHVAFATVGHTFDPPLEDAVRAELPWLVDGDTRWAFTAADGG